MQQHLDASREDHRHRRSPTTRFGRAVELDPVVSRSVILLAMSSHMSESS
jgi:hypothetical protein